MLPQGIFSVAVTVGALPDDGAARGPRRLPGFGRAVDTGLRQIGFLLIPAAPSRPSSPSRSSGSSTSAASSRRPDPRWSRGALAAFSLGLVFNGWMLLLDAGVLQPPVELDPDRGRGREPRRSTRCSTRSSTASASGGSRSRPAVANIAGAVALLVLLRRGSASGGAARCGAAADHRSRRPRSPRSPSASGGAWTRSWDGVRAVASVGLALGGRRRAYLGACRLLRVGEVGLLGVRASRRLVTRPAGFAIMGRDAPPRALARALAVLLPAGSWLRRARLVRCSSRRAVGADDGCSCRPGCAADRPAGADRGGSAMHAAPAHRPVRAPGLCRRTIPAARSVIDAQNRFIADSFHHLIDESGIVHIEAADAAGRCHARSRVPFWRVGRAPRRGRASARSPRRGRRARAPVRANGTPWPAATRAGSC